MRFKTITATATAVATVAAGLLASGCGSSGSSKASSSSGGASGTASGGGSAAKSPIKLGVLFTSAAGVDYSSAPPGAQAYFARLNAAGGIGGHPVRVEVQNDGGNPSTAASAARKLLGDGVVAFVGGDSTVDCAVNARLYAANNIVSLPALGSNPACFGSPQIIPAQNGALTGAIQSASLAVDKLHRHRVQYITFDAPSGHASDAPVQGYLKLRGASAGPTAYVTPGQDPTPAILRAKRSNADAYLILATPDVSVSIVKALAAQGVDATKVTTIGVITLYDTSVPKALGAAGEGVWATTDWLPFDASNGSTSAALSDFRNAMSRFEPSARLDALAQSGWVAADLLAQGLRKVTGSFTPAAVSAAVKQVSGYSDGLTGGPLSIGQRPNYLINPYDFVVRIKGGQWYQEKQLGTVTFPPTGFKLPG